jgi:hypothetical protein
VYRPNQKEGNHIYPNRNLHYIQKNVFQAQRLAITWPTALAYGLHSLQKVFLLGRRLVDGRFFNALGQNSKAITVLAGHEAHQAWRPGQESPEQSDETYDPYLPSISFGIGGASRPMTFGVRTIRTSFFTLYVTSLEKRNGKIDPSMGNLLFRF